MTRAVPRPGHVIGALVHRLLPLWLAPLCLAHGGPLSGMMAPERAAAVTPQVGGRQSFSVQGQMVNIFGFVGQMVSVAGTRLCLESLKQLRTVRRQMGTAA